MSRSKLAAERQTLSADLYILGNYETIAEVCSNHCLYYGNDSIRYIVHRIDHFESPLRSGGAKITLIAEHTFILGGMGELVTRAEVLAEKIVEYTDRGDYTIVTPTQTLFYGRY